jgi:hypothetical protein
MNKQPTTNLGIDALQDIIREVVKAAKAAADGYHNEDLIVYFNAVVDIARNANTSLAEARDLEPREVFLLNESISASVREAFFPALESAAEAV